MFKISPIQDVTEQAMLAEKCGAPHRDGSFAYAMTDAASGEIMGISQFEIKDGCGYIYDLRCRIGYSDNEAMFILGRATMNFIDLCGVHKCKCSPDAGDSAIIHAIGFKAKEDGEPVCDMTGMFDGHCDGSTVKI